MTTRTQAVLGAELHRGSLRVSLGDVLVFAVTVTAAFLVSAILRFVLEEDVYPRLNLGRGLPNALSSLLPNASLTTDKGINWTLSDHRRRIDIPVGVAYGTAPEKTLDILLGVARAHPRVLAKPRPVALFRGFGDSALRFELRVWTDRFNLGAEIQSALSVALYLALQEAGIEIPLPQREVRLHHA